VSHQDQEQESCDHDVQAAVLESLRIEGE